MVSSDFRAKAREKLTGKWGKAAIMMLCYFAYILIIEYISGHTTGFLAFAISIAAVVINVPVVYGVSMAFLKLYNDEEVGYFDFFTLGFENFSRAWSVVWNIFLKILVPFILFIVSYVIIFVGIGATSSSNSFGALSALGVILLIVSTIWLVLESFYYELAQYIAIENANMTGKEVAEESKRLMTNRRWKLFCLQFSFIGWAILASLTFGIGMLWLTPYMLFATLAFYKFTLGNKEEVVEKPVVEPTPEPVVEPTEEPAPEPVEDVIEEPTEEPTDNAGE